MTILCYKDCFHQTFNYSALRANRIQELIATKGFFHFVCSLQHVSRPFQEIIRQWQSIRLLSKLFSRVLWDEKEFFSLMPHFAIFIKLYFCIHAGSCWQLIALQWATGNIFCKLKKSKIDILKIIPIKKFPVEEILKKKV